MKSYFFRWRTLPKNSRVYHDGVLSVKAKSFEDAMEKVEKKIRSLRESFMNVPLKIIELGDKE